MSTYRKPHLTFDQQLDLLKSRGLSVAEVPKALAALERVGYYRLSAYWYPLRNYKYVRDPNDSTKVLVRREDTFNAGSQFEHAVALYEFDRRLRLLILDALERVEVAVRVDVAYLLGAKDPFAHENAALLDGTFSKRIDPKLGRPRHQEWLDKHAALVDRSKEDFVQHYRTTYGMPLPIWVAIELWDFGMLSTFYPGMAFADRVTIASQYGVSDWQVMASWLRTLNYVRNVVAHHSRLWNRNLIDQPSLPKPGDIAMFDPLHGKGDMIARLYVVICILSHLLGRLQPTSDWLQQMYDLVQTFPTVPGITVADMGFPPDWQTHAFGSLAVPPSIPGGPSSETKH